MGGYVLEIRLTKVANGLDIGDRCEKEKSRVTSRFGTCSISWWSCYILRQGKQRGKYCCRVEVRVLFGLSENWGAYLKVPNMYMNELDMFGAWWRQVRDRDRIWIWKLVVCRWYLKPWDKMKLPWIFVYSLTYAFSSYRVKLYPHYIAGTCFNYTTYINLVLLLFSKIF